MVARRLRIGVVGTVLLVALAGVACSKDSSGGGSTPAGGGVTMGVKDFQFDPSTLAVKSGTTTITITNTGTVTHNFSLDDGTASQDIPAGETKTVTVTLSADATFHCKYHPTQMTGTLTVSG